MANRIIAATPVLLMPGCMPHRFVLIEKTQDMHSTFCKYPGKGDVDEYVVWTETFYEDNLTKHAGYNSGQYFMVLAADCKKDAFSRAYNFWLNKAEYVNEYIKNGTFEVV